MVEFARLVESLPNVTRGIACAGTALESQTFAVNKKTFLFLSPKEARLKLDDSVAQAKAMGLAVGANGWVKIPLADVPGTSILQQWIAESYSLMAPAAKAPRAAARSKSAKK